MHYLITPRFRTGLSHMYLKIKLKAKAKAKKKKSYIIGRCQEFIQQNIHSHSHRVYPLISACHSACRRASVNNFRILLSVSSILNGCVNECITCFYKTIDGEFDSECLIVLSAEAVEYTDCTLQRGKTPPQWVSCIRHLTIWWRGSSEAGALGNAEHSIIAIATKTTLAWNGSIR